MKTFLTWLALGAAVSACGGDEAPSPSSCDGIEVVVAASDYSSSAICGAPAQACQQGLDLGRDPQLASENGRLFFLARDNDLVFELDETCGTAKARFSVHDLSPTAKGAANPHDVAAAADGTVFVALYNTPKIAVVERGAVTGSIDLSSFDADGNPQAESVRIVGDKAFVALERLDDADRLRSKQTSQMLRIDVATRKIEAAIDLAGRNPFNPMVEQGGALYLAEPGNFDAADEPLAGIERFDTKTSATKLLVAEKDLGASVAQIAVSDGCGAAIVAGPVPNVNPTSLVTFDPSSGKVLRSASSPALGPTPGYDLQGLAWRDRTLYVGDRRAGSPGYRIHVLERDDACNLHETRTLEVAQRPVALRPAGVR
jgi:hypothetical protein